MPATILNKEGIVEINARQSNLYIYSPGLFMNENEQHAKVIKFILAVINLSTRLSMLAYPVYNLVYLFLDKSYLKAGTNLFFQILYGALNVLGLVISAGYLIGSIGNTRYCYDGIVRANQESKRAWKAYLGSFPVPIFFLILYALINLWMVK